MSAKFLKKSINILKAVKAEYRITLPNGDTYTNISTIKTRRRRKLARGLLSRHYLPYIRSIRHGQLVEIPYSKFNGETLQRCVSSYARYLYGKGSVMTSRNDKRKVVEIMRA